MSERRIRADDGVELALYRERAYRDGRAAVLLVHGAFTNHRVWLRSADSRGGFANFLSAAGFDVWLADLRHHGASAREPRPLTWRFEDWVLRDAPALVARVREETGDARLVWIGHSAGGAVGLCWLARLRPTPAPAGVVTFGTPGPRAMGPVRWTLAAATIALARALGRFPARPFGFGSEDEAAGIVSEWLRWNVRGGWVGGDGFDYFAALDAVHTPFLAVAGEADRMFAPPRACGQVVDQVRATRKELSIHAGLSHRGLLLSARARERCWPHVAEWMKDTLLETS